MWNKEISKEHFQTKDLYINNHSNSVNLRKTKLTWSEGISGKHFPIRDLGINNPSKYTQTM